MMFSVVTDLEVCHPNLPCPDFYRKDNLVPIHIEGRGMLFMGFGGATGKGWHTVVGLGVAGLNFLLGVALFLFSATSLFLTFGLVSGSGGLNWLLGTGTGIGPILPSTSRNVFIYFMIVGWR